MADFTEVTQAIESRLDGQKRKILNRNAFNALIGAVGGVFGGDPGPAIEGLRKIFLGREEALDAERKKIAQRAILQLVCKIDDALTDANVAASTAG